MNSDTLNNYIFNEGLTESNIKEKKSVEIEKIFKFFKKEIKLKNSLKRCFWNREANVF